jgi:transcriptional regulator with XRE-family HTH domain
MVNEMTDFADWLARELEKRGWTHQDLADRGGFTRPSVTQVLNGKQNPGLEFCKGVARAFGMRPETVLRKAGHLPPLPGETEDASLGRWWEFGKQLTPEEREEAIRYAMWAFLGGRPRRPEERNPNGEEPSPSSAE